MKKMFFSFSLLLLIISFGYQFNLQAQKNVPAASLKFGDPLPANAFVELAKLINPAVMNIFSTTTPRMMRQDRDPFYDMLEQLYGLHVNPQQARPQTALGSGFVIREDGLIVTNNHVIAGADKIQVQFDEKSDKKYDAVVVGSDERTDIALLKIEGKGFPVVQMGSSKDTEVGEWVAAFGNPFGIGHTMTKGIISAKGRDIGELNRFPLFQTDAPINPGNSGGPLVNMKGQVIGVNNAIDARAQAIGFAIPIDEVKSILPQLEKNGRIRKGYLGVGLANLDPQTAMALGLKDLEGAVVATVEPGGPAQKAGLRPYDVITEFNGHKIESSAELSNAVADSTIGTDAKLKIVREGKTKYLTASVAERPESNRQRGRANRKSVAGQNLGTTGFTVANPDSDLRKEFNLEDDIKKPIVTEVLPGSPAASAGILPGDIILDVNRKEVNTAQDVTKQIRKGSNTLRVARQGAFLFLIIKLE